MPAQAWITVVTSGLYTRAKFISEARRLWANRAIAAAVLKQMEWGQPILVADFPKERVQVNEVTKRRKVIKERVYLTGTATVFGYFTVDNVTPIGFTPSAKREFLSSLQVVRNWRGVIHVQRACGSYTITGGCEVKNSLADLVTKAEEVAASHRLKLKWFVGGRYHPLSPVKVPNIKYFRGYRKVELDSVPEPGKPVRIVQFASSYRYGKPKEE